MNGPLKLTNKGASLLDCYYRSGKKSFRCCGTVESFMANSERDSPQLSSKIEIVWGSLNHITVETQRRTSWNWWAPAYQRVQKYHQFTILGRQSRSCLGHSQQNDSQILKQQFSEIFKRVVRKYIRNTSLQPVPIQNYLIWYHTIPAKTKNNSKLPKIPEMNGVASESRRTT